MKIEIEKQKDYFDLFFHFEVKKVFNIELKIVNEVGQDFGFFSKNQLVFQKNENDILSIRVNCASRTYRVYVKLFAEGKLVELDSLIVETDQVEGQEKITVINKGALIECCEDYKNKEKSSFFIVHNTKISWRNEENEEVSLFTVNGELLFLREYLAEVWRNIGEGKDYLSLSKNNNIDMLNAALDVLILKRYIHVLEI